MTTKHDGPPPKPDSQRRRTNKPASYGLAEPIRAGQAAKQPDLGFNAHPMVRDLWNSLNESVEARFFSAADWQRARLELVFLDSVLAEGRMTHSNWARVQAGLSELLVSPADKRRAGIELKAAGDPDEDAAVVQMARYQDKLAQ